MKRKVIKLATNTLVVSIPSKWAKQRGIQKGDELEITETPHAIIFSSSQAGHRKKALVLGNNPALAARQINRAYKHGYDEVEVQYENPAAYAAMLEELQNLVGFEVVMSGKNSCVIKNIATGEVENLDAVLRRVFLSVLEMAESADEYARTHAERAKDHLAVSEKNVDKLTDFCKRLLNKHGAADIAQTTLLYGVLRDLERIADQYAGIPEATFPREFLPALSDTHKLLRLLYELFYAFDTAKAEQLMEKLGTAKNHVNILLQKSTHARAAHAVATLTQLLDEMAWAAHAHSS